MDPNWNDNQPIYRQLRDRMVALILEGALKEGDPLPSVRAVAADYRLNPLTVLKGYQQLVDERLVEKRRGRGMFVSEGARRLLLAGERERFLTEEWPHILAFSINRSLRSMPGPRGRAPTSIAKSQSLKAMSASCVAETLFKVGNAQSFNSITTPCTAAAAAGISSRFKLIGCSVPSIWPEATRNASA